MVTFDPRIGLATSLSAQPGVYAFLIGSGVSTGAGIPTGWGVVETLARRAAIASGAQVGDDFDAEKWWAAAGDGQPLGYSNLLERLAPTPAARRALLAGFFEPTEDDQEAHLKVPGAAHRAIASLVRDGIVRVIVTTNFDRLLERAIEAEGISPQVITSETAIAGMEPLQHMKCTILKLHGDYASLDQRNTVDELSQYPPATTQLLNRILSEYGLIVSGWSGDWDPALVSAMEASTNRRYPLYWATRSQLGEAATRLTTRNGVHVVTGVVADDFFPDLLQRVDALQQMVETPESVNMMLARLKRALPNPVRHIEVRDLFEIELDKLSEFLRQFVEAPGETWGDIDHAMTELQRHSSTLIQLLSTGIFLDRDRQHTELWVQVIQRAMSARPPRNAQSRWDTIAHYPAHLLLRAGTMAALLADHEDVARAILQRPKWSSIFYERGNECPAWDVLDPDNILDKAAANELPRNEGQRWHWPLSRMARNDLSAFIVPLAGGQDYHRLHNRAEYRAALAWQFAPEAEKVRRWPTDGEFLGSGQWTRDDSEDSIWAADFRLNGDAIAWGYSPEKEEWFTDQLNALSEQLQKMRHWG